MRPARSIRARLLAGAGLVLLLFLAGAGFALQQAHADSVRASHFSRLQATVYLLLAQAEVNADGSLEMPLEFAEPRLSLPGSGLYATIHNVQRNENWRSASTLGLDTPFLRALPPGEWRQELVQSGAREFLAVSYGVRWTARSRPVPLVLSVLEDRAGFDREVAVFARTLWTWLGGAGVLLLAAQLLLLRWGLAPLAKVAQEVRRVEAGQQAAIAGTYPTELAGLTDNLNTLIRQERERQTRYKEALSYLAHSLKTPLAVLRGALAEPAQLPAAVDEQVRRMDDIVQHQLARAAAGGATRFAPALLLAPVVARIRDAVAKVHADRGLAITAECPADLAWRIDEGDLFEIFGNLLDNAGKWARQRVQLKVWREAGSLRLRVEDDGPGFADTESILQIHVRGDERVPGHGVGLAVVKDLVSSHHGELRLSRSDTLDGARVDVLLPPP
jgi:two-component system sensor histidine kinase PhoQ